MRRPPAADAPGLGMRYPWRGRRLFSTTHKTLTHELVRMMSYAEESRGAYERGSTEERRRIARDLHDDVGAKLLSLVYRAGDRGSADLARSALQDLRDVVSHTQHEQLTLEEALAMRGTGWEGDLDEMRAGNSVEHL